MLIIPGRAKKETIKDKLLSGETKAQMHRCGADANAGLGAVSPRLPPRGQSDRAPEDPLSGFPAASGFQVRPGGPSHQASTGKAPHESPRPGMACQRPGPREVRSDPRGPSKPKYGVGGSGRSWSLQVPAAPPPPAQGTYLPGAQPYDGHLGAVVEHEVAGHDR